jgi:hypothetical protein
METIKLSGGSARAGQLMLILFFTPVILLVFYLVLVKNFSTNGLLFLLFFLSITILILYIGFSYADLFVSENYLIIKRIFKTKKMHLSDIQNIDRGLIPFSYHIKFKDDSRIKFKSKYTDVPKLFFSMDPDKGLKEIKSILLKNGNPDNDISKNSTKC